ncbi:MAG TPA: hypothetical protein VFP40_16900 [Terriglobales bacterium]|nr:hypothetical protein [Terriglobales bacterium]
MVPELRSAFNAAFTADKYEKFLERLHRRCQTPIPFRVCETPCFFPESIIKELSNAGTQLIRQLVDDPSYRKASDVTIPPEWNVPNENERPMFIQVDFGLVRNESGKLKPCLVELQAFPSLYFYQPALAEEYVASYGLDPKLKLFLSGLDKRSYIELMRSAIVGDRDPENVVLLEVDPFHQKTLPDFLLTRGTLGIPIVDIREVVKQGSRLHYKKDGKLVPIQRIYNRAIVDELVRKNLKLPFDYRDELQVEWAGHPNWYFRMSKFSLPFLKHESVPKTWFLSDVKELPADRENYVLKPLYSFAGAGITFGPTDEQINAIPHSQRSLYILQERVNFERTIETPHGPTQPEIRMMYVWLDELTPVMSLIRMGRGKMMGVDHNRDLEWVGSSASLIA